MLLFVAFGHAVGAFARDEQIELIHAATSEQEVTGSQSAVAREPGDRAGVFTLYTAPHGDPRKSPRSADEPHQGAMRAAKPSHFVRLRLCHFSDFHSSYELRSSPSSRLPPEPSCCGTKSGNGYLGRLAIMQYILDSLCGTKPEAYSLDDGKIKGSTKRRRNNLGQMSPKGLGDGSRTILESLPHPQAPQDQHPGEKASRSAEHSQSAAETYAHEEGKSNEKQERNTSHSLRLFGGDMSPGKAEYDAFGGTLAGSTLKELEVMTDCGYCLCSPLSEGVSARQKLPGAFQTTYMNINSG